MASFESIAIFLHNGSKGIIENGSSISTPISSIPRKIKDIHNMAGAVRRPVQGYSAKGSVVSQSMSFRREQGQSGSEWESRRAVDLLTDREV